MRGAAAPARRRRPRPFLPSAEASTRLRALDISGAFQLQAGGLLPLARCTRLVHLACNDSTVTDEELGPIW